MKRFLIALSLMFMMNFSIAANGNEDAKTVEYKQIDKTTQMAMIYDSEGNLVEKGLLVKGQREGVWQGFDKYGKLTAEVSFKNGVKDGVWKIYNNAELVYVLFYQEGNRLMAENLAVVQ